LWAIPTDGKPQSLGVLVADQAIRLNASSFKTGVLDASVIAVSVEPLKGSPTGLPTGQVIASGKLY
jgi:anti-sigma-K factor RskA